MQRSVDGLWGKEYESRMLASNDDFVGPFEGDFIPLNDADLKNSFAATDTPIPQPKNSPGQKGIPTLDQFRTIPESLRDLFRKVHFETDEYVLRDPSDVQAILQMASYLKKIQMFISWWLAIVMRERLLAITWLLECAARIIFVGCL